MYNVKVKKFGDSLQVQVFSKAVNSSGDDALKRLDPLTGEIREKIPKKKKPIGEYQECPFSEHGADYLVNMEDRVKSASQRSLRRTVNSIYDIARSNKWEWFFTLTFGNEEVRMNYEIMYMIEKRIESYEAQNGEIDLSTRAENSNK